jgi:hypothetical protein
MADVDRTRRELPTGNRQAQLDAARTALDWARGHLERVVAPDPPPAPPRQGRLNDLRYGT